MSDPEVCNEQHTRSDETLTNDISMWLRMFLRRVSVCGVCLSLSLSLSLCVCVCVSVCVSVWVCVFLSVSVSVSLGVHDGSQWRIKYGRWCVSHEDGAENVYQQCFEDVRGVMESLRNHASATGNEWLSASLRTTTNNGTLTHSQLTDTHTISPT